MTGLAVDLGGTKVAVRCGDRTVHTPWPQGERLAADVATLRSVLEALPTDRPDRAVVAAAPAVGADGVVRSWPRRPHWVGYDLAGLIRSASGVRTVECVDDGALAALAEAAALGFPDLLYFGVGTGLACGAMSGGAIVDPERLGRAAHTLLPAASAVRRTGAASCRCGRACVQSVASGPAILARAGVDGSTFAELAATGDAVARRLIAEAADALAWLAGRLRQPTVVVGGGFGSAVPELTAAVAARCTGLRVLRAAGAESSLDGAVLRVRLGGSG